MNHYYIISDSCLDFSPEEIKAKEVSLVPINTVMNDIEYGLNREQISLEDFFSKNQRGGKTNNCGSQSFKLPGFF